VNESDLKTLLDNLDKLELSRSSLHGWLHFWTFLVVVGVALEVVFVIWEYAEELHDFRRGIVHPPEKPNMLLFVLGLLGAGLVASGVAGELYIDVQAGKVETEIRKLNELRVSLLSKEAGDAKTSATEAEGAAKRARDQSDKATASASNALGLASGARREADSFEGDIRSAKQQAADAESHLADALERAAEASRELAKLKTPRSLSEEQQKRIVAKIKRFPEIPFDLWVSSDSDSTALMGLIDATLRSAEWKFNSTGSPIEFAGKAGVIASSGISIHVAQEHRGEWEPAVIALRDALIAEGIPAIGVADDFDTEKDKKRDRIHVMIGSKPLN
jgi:hypothetical protein